MCTLFTWDISTGLHSTSISVRAWTVPKARKAMPAFPFEIKLDMQHRVDLQTAARRKWNKTLRLQGSRKRYIFAHRLVGTPWKRRLRANLSCVQ